MALVVALAALAAAAAVEALRGGGPERSGSAPSRTVASPEAETARALAGAGIEGVLFYTETSFETSSCRLRAFRLPELRATEAPRWEHCSVSLWPDGRHAAEGGAAWRRDGQLYALDSVGGVDVVSSTTRWAHRFEPARAPAFKPNGALTLVRRGQLIEWTTACRPQAPSLVFREPGPTRRCARVLRTETELTEAARRVPRPAGTRLALADVAWLDDRRFAALVEAGAAAHRDSLAFYAVPQPVARAPYIAISAQDVDWAVAR